MEGLKRCESWWISFEKQGRCFSRHQKCIRRGRWDTHSSHFGSIFLFLGKWWKWWKMECFCVPPPMICIFGVLRSNDLASQMAKLTKITNMWILTSFEGFWWKIRKSGRDSQICENGHFGHLRSNDLAPQNDKNEIVGGGYTKTCTFWWNLSIS